MTDLLLRGADVILANGLAHQTYIDLTAGDKPLPVAQCPVCPRSALALAAEVDPLFAVEWPMHCVSFEEDEQGRVGSEAERAAYAEILSAEERLRRYLVEQLGYRAPLELSDGTVIEFWADEDERTQPEVVGAMRAAAEYRPATAR